MQSKSEWDRFRKYFYFERGIGFGMDVSRMNFEASFLESMQPAILAAINGMTELEKGALANPDEKRMVGHYWLRSPSLAPNSVIRSEIETCLAKISAFVESLHKAKIRPEKSPSFKYYLVVGIGGSALGPQFVSNALETKSDKLKPYFFDNTDPDGMDKVLAKIPNLDETVVLVISKSGGTKETRNGQLEAKEAFNKAGLNFARHFVAVTQDGSELFKTAKSEKWLEIFPMWDWVGGRTSELSAVGLLPAALQGFDIIGMLEGAKEMDALTRSPDVLRNPAAMMALMWYHAGGGKGNKSMVVLPYKDRLELFSKYLQQLVMESLGKAHDLDGKLVEQGIAVYGNKGSTDQHAYVQQLRDGINNFFAVFIEVLKDRSSPSPFEVEPGVTSGDYLSGFFQGTRNALSENERESITITINEVNAKYIGALIALFERAVGLYASLINVNAYHQPGVEAGKKAAQVVLELQGRILAFLRTQKTPLSVEQIAVGANAADQIETTFKILQHLAANKRIGVDLGPNVFEDKYAI